MIPGMLLKEIYFDLCSRHSDDQHLITKLWDELEKAYSGKGRSYHTLLHLSSMYMWIGEVNSVFSNADAVLFALYYHDYVYDTWRNDNEEQSAIIAREHLTLLGSRSELIETASRFILATKKHEVSGDIETDTFTDIDLSILGAPANDYDVYADQIRQEYLIIPDILYKAGRKKVLIHFLEMEVIYKTSYFREKFEALARENIARELARVS